MLSRQRILLFSRFNSSDPVACSGGNATTVLLACYAARTVRPRVKAPSSGRLRLRAFWLQSDLTHAGLGETKSEVLFIGIRAVEALTRVGTPSCPAVARPAVALGQSEQSSSFDVQRRKAEKQKHRKILKLQFSKLYYSRESYAWTRVRTSDFAVCLSDYSNWATFGDQLRRS